uniref:Uncharacterized protein n=1 Tax=Anguilla anguilla TaxID=7936 RepID=A0A0E9QZA5_ANGAN
MLERYTGVILPEPVSLNLNFQTSEP